MTNPNASGAPMGDNDLSGLTYADARQHIAALRAKADAVDGEEVASKLQVIRRELQIDQLIRMIPDLKTVIAAHQSPQGYVSRGVGPTASSGTLDEAQALCLQAAEQLQGWMYRPESTFVIAWPPENPQALAKALTDAGRALTRFFASSTNPNRAAVL